MPEVPVERLKAIWRREKLNRTIQLTISGCLGPCDVPNVVMILTPAGSEWLGLIDGDADYDLLIEWARACDSDDALVPLPERLLAHRFHRFSAEVVTA
jgi:cobaltochelatase CobN